MSELFTFKDSDVYVLDDLIKENSLELGRGDVISKIDVRDTPGSYPIYSSSAQNNGKMGEYGKFMFDEELITWSVDGGGKFFHRPKHKFSVTNVCGYLRLKSKRLDYKYLHSILEFQHDRLSFDYQSKAHPSVIRELYQVPLLEIKEQQKIAEILTSVDQVIENTQYQINKLEDLKKATMSELLTKGIGHTEFRETEIGRVPNKWRIVYMKEIAKFSGGSAFNESLQGNSSGDFPFIKVSDMNHPENTVWIQKSQNWITSQTRDSERIKLFPKNTIVFAKVGAALLTNRRRILVRDTAIDNNMMGAVAKDCNFMFLFWLLNSIDFRRIVQDGAVPSINQSQLDELKVALPDSDEQTKIAHILQSLHDRLDILRDKLDSRKKLKQSLMQDLLTGKVRVTVN